MSLWLAQLKSRFTLLGLSILILGLGLFFAWRSVSSTGTVSSANLPTRLHTPEITRSPALTVASSTPYSTPTTAAESGYPPTPDPNGKAEFETAVAQHDIEISTEVALTHEPTRTPGEPPIYPTETPVMGILNGCANASSRGPQCYNAWRGVINREIIQVEAGGEGSDGDESQGLLMVDNWNLRTEDIYRTPRRVGEVEIVAVDGTRFTLAAVSTEWTTATPGTTFVFDLATRQWVNP